MKKNASLPAIPLRKSRKLLWILTGIAFAMFGFGFGLVPLYNVLCDITGLNGKTNTDSVLASQSVDRSRVITVQFLAINNADLPWDFYPITKKIIVHPGENTRVAYYAHNRAPGTMTVQAIPSVAPGLAAKFLKKTECFCFTQQTFRSNDAKEMPILFHIDTALPKDVTTLTLAYTLFDAAKFSKNRGVVPGKINGR